jgi:hypothetical protein
MKKALMMAVGISAILAAGVLTMTSMSQSVLAAGGNGGTPGGLKCTSNGPGVCAGGSGGGSQSGGGSGGGGAFVGNDFHGKP